MKSLFSLSIVGLLLAASTVFAETVTAQPGQSLQEAVDKLDPGDTLLLAEGTYYQSFALTKSGTAEKPITIKAKAPGKVIITGAMEAAPKFERVEGVIHKPVPASVSATFEPAKLEPVEGAIYKIKDNTVAGNIIYDREWNFCSGLPWGEGLEIEKNNLCVGPLMEAGKPKHSPPSVLCSRNKEPFVKEQVYFRDVMPPSVPGLVGEEEIGEEIEIGRADFAVSGEYVQAAVEECGLDGAEYKDLHEKVGAVPPGTRWEFLRPGPRWAVGELALFHPPLPPSLDPWWVGFAEKPSDAKTVKIKPWRGKFYKKFQNSGDGSDPK